MNTMTQVDQTETTRESDSERRGDTRIPCALEVRCRSAFGPEWPALAVNVSVYGARLVSFLEAQPDPLVSICLKNRKGQTVEVPAVLVHAQGCRNLWMMGCRFERPLTDEQICALVPSSRRRKTSA
jgi:hypothetical protein